MLFTIKCQSLPLRISEPSFFPFFSLPPAYIIPSYSFFLFPSLLYKITYSSNHNFLSWAHTFFFVFFNFFSNFIFYNCLNSIQKLIYDRQRKDNTYTMSLLFFFFFSCLVFEAELVFFFPFSLGLCVFSCLSSFSFLFFWGPCVDSCLSSFSFLFFIGGAAFSFSCFCFFFLFLFF